MESGYFEPTTRKSRGAVDAAPSGDDRFRAIFENAVVGIEQVDADGRLIEVNRRLCEMLGYSRDELMAMHFEELSHPDDVAAERAKIALLAAGQATSYRMEKRTLRRNGAYLWVEISSSAVRDEEGRWLHRVSVIQDISDRKRESEDAARYKALFAQSPFSIVLIDPEDGRLVDFNDHAHKSLGYSRREFAELTVADIEEEARPEEFDARVAKLVATGKDHFDAQHKTKTGEPRDVMVTARRIQIEGRWLLQSVWQDVTSLRRAGEEKARHDALVRQIINSSPLPMGIVELSEDDGDVLHVLDNPATCRYFGVAGGATSGRWDHADLGVPKETVETWVAAYRGSQRSSHPVHFEDCHEHGGAPRWLGVVVSHVGRHANGRDRFCYIAEDITERRKAEAERERLLLTLRDNDRRKDEFLAMLAHELRNPLSAVSNAVQILQLKGPADPDMQWSCDVIQRQARLLSRLLDDLLDVSRISRGKVMLRRETIDLRETIRRAAETTRPLVEQKNHTLDLHLPADPLHASADPARMEQVVVNLVSNAAKYSEEGRRIVVVGEREGRDVVVRVKDQGIGIPPEILSQVFELFTQAETSIDRSQGGLGVGLTIVKSLVEMHGGSITATSAGANRGSEFVVRLPALDSALAGASVSEQASDADSPPRRIVVVDDNIDANRGIARVLASFGHEVETAYDGIAALDLIDSFLPRVVLLDIGLPGMDGFEVAARLRRRPYGKDLLLVAVTGYGQESDRRRSLAAGIDHHLVKPIDVERLRTLIDETPTAAEADR